MASTIIFSSHHSCRAGWTDVDSLSGRDCPIQNIINITRAVFAIKTVSRPSHNWSQVEADKWYLAKRFNSNNIRRIGFIRWINYLGFFNRAMHACSLRWLSFIRSLSHFIVYTLCINTRFFFSWSHFWLCR